MDRIPPCPRPTSQCRYSKGASGRGLPREEPDAVAKAIEGGCRCSAAACSGPVRRSACDPLRRASVADQRLLAMARRPLERTGRADQRAVRRGDRDRCLDRYGGGRTSQTVATVPGSLSREYTRRGEPVVPSHPDADSVWTG